MGFRIDPARWVEAAAEGPSAYEPAKGNTALGGPATSGEEAGGPPERPGGRTLEPWERELEPFQGATALEDLETAYDDPDASAAIVARYAAIRLVLRAFDGTPAATLAEERAAAVAYLAEGEAFGAAERAALRDVIRLASALPHRALVATLIEAGEHARKRGHDRGAFACLRTAFWFGVAGGWPAEAACAADLTVRLARDGGGRRSVRLWRRRAAVLAGRAARDAESAATDGSGS